MKQLQTKGGMAGTGVSGRWGTVLALLLITYLALTPLSMPVIDTWNDKVKHLLAFAALAFGLRRYWGLSWWVVLAGLTGYGVGIELAQSFIPNRVASWGDVVADVAGIVGGEGMFSVFRFRFSVKK